jgi:uncharacterized repeat protein (TIGR03806 family)
MTASPSIAIFFRLTKLLFLWSLVCQTVFAQVGIDIRPSNFTCTVPERPATDASVSLELVLGLSFPLAMVQAPNDAGKWYVVDRAGFINVYQNGATFTLLGSFVDIRDRVEREFSGRDWGEMGLLGIAFHPDFASNGYVYLYYSAAGTNPGWPLEGRVSRFRSFDGGLTLDPNSEVQLIRVDRDTQWHWGGQMLFGTDGYLYMSFGDGGRHLNAQNKDTLKGKMLRIDVDGGTPYAIPADNPFAAGGGRGEIYAYGFRNPWRFNFDPENQDIWLGDVGLNEYEEIDKVVKGGNYGWSYLEGPACSGLTACNPPADVIDPVYAYPHDPNSAFNAVIGGYVYRGSALANLQGVYIYGDNYTGEVYALRFDQSGNPAPQLLIESGEFLLSFAEGADRELYLLAQNGVYRVVNSGAGPNGNTDFPQLLSETGCFSPTNPSLALPGLIPYTVNAPLWSDGAAKERWMALPDGTTIDADSNGDFEFPIGTVLAKSFRIGGQLVETRLLMRHDDGDWGGYSYEWNDQQTDAALLPADKLKLVNGQSWYFPGRSQCMQCHTDVAKRALGPEIAQLNGEMVYPSSGIAANQLATLEHIGMFSAPLPDVPGNLPALVAVNDFTHSAQERARSYLYSNCAFCHQPGGPGQGPQDFRYWLPDSQIGAIGELPTQGDLGVADAQLIYPGRPDKSILSLRVHALDSSRMPPLATSMVDTEATDAIDEWIRSLGSSETCGAPAYDPNVSAAFYVWEECGTGVWKVRVTAAGTYSRIGGELVSNQPLSFVDPAGLVESHDLFDTSDPERVTFDFQMWGASEDGFDFGIQSGSGACFTLNLPVLLRVGPNATPTAQPVNLETLGPCSAPPPSGMVDGRPTFSAGSDKDMFLWRDVDDTWRVAVTAGGDYANYIGSISAEQAFPSVTPLSIESHDVFDFTTNASTIDFNLQTWNVGEDTFNFRIPATGVTCIDLTAPWPNASVVVGASNIRVSTPFNLRTLEPCLTGPPPEPAPQCGDPQISGPVDFGLHVWQDCNYSGPGARWHVTIGGGGSTWAGYAGSVNSNVLISAVGSQLEPTDTLDSTPGDNVVDFVLYTGGTGVDSFQIDVPAGSQTCFVPQFFFSGQVYRLGDDREPISGSFDMLTMGACN